MRITRAKRLLKDLLAAQLPTQLTAADTNIADGWTTPVPVEIHTTDKGDFGGLPSVEIILTDAAPTQDLQSPQIYRNRLVVGVTVGGDDEEKVSAWLERYLWAIRQVARDAYLIPTTDLGPVDTGGEQYTPLQQAPSTVEYPFVKGAFIEVFVQTFE